MNQIDIVKMKRHRLGCEIKNLEEKLDALKEQKKDLDETYMILQQSDPNEKKIIYHNISQEQK